MFIPGSLWPGSEILRLYSTTKSQYTVISILHIVGLEKSGYVRTHILALLGFAHHLVSLMEMADPEVSVEEKRDFSAQ